MTAQDNGDQLNRETGTSAFFKVRQTHNNQ